MATNQSDNFQGNYPKNLDNKKGRWENGQWRPYSSLSEVLAALPQSARYKTLTVPVIVSGVTVEYWFRDGVTDGSLIQKTTSGGGGSGGEYRSTEVYNSVDVRDGASNYSVIIPALIGADLSFFRAYRGNGTFLSGFTTPATSTSVQVNTTTGRVTYFDPFDPAVSESLSFDYKVGTIVPPDPGGDELFINGVFSFDTVFDFNKKFNFN